MRSATSRWRRWPRGVYIHTAFWQFLPVAIVFYTACLVHAGLGIWALYQRREFGWKAVEPLQLLLGLSIPLLVIAHIVGVRMGQTLFGHEKLYPQEFYLFFVLAPSRLWQMLAVLVIAWVHGCIGLYFWLRMKPFFKRAAPFLLSAAVLIPTLAMLGIYQGGRSVVADYDDADWRIKNLTQRQVGTAAQQQVLERITGGMIIGYLGLLGLVLLARGARAIHERRGGMVSLSYGNGRTVRVPKGLSVLEASLRHNVPHASVLRRPRALLDLPHPHHRRLQRFAPAFAARGFRARTGRHRRSVDPPRLPAQADHRSVVLPAVPAAHDVGQFATRRTRPGSARSAIWSACSWICAARPSSPKNACRSTPSSSSTASSARCRRR